MLSDLIVEGFLSEERFAIAYVGGKFRIKKWGRHKILQGLKQHKISEYCIKMGLKEIDEKDYYEVLTSLLVKKVASAKATNDYGRRNKIVRYALGRGFEMVLIWEVITAEGL